MEHKIFLRSINDYICLIQLLCPNDDCFGNFLSYVIHISVNMNVFMPPMLAVT